MSNIFNLNSKDYDINELKDLLNLRDPYTLKDIVKNEDILREKLLLDTAVSTQKKKEIITFLESVKDILIKHAQEEFKNIIPEEIINREHSIIARSKIIENLNAVSRDDEGYVVNKNTMHKLLCLDSRFRDNYYTTLSTNYMLTLPTVIKNVVSIELSALEIPSTYFQISKSKGNNFFWFQWVDPVRLYLSQHDPSGIGSGDYTPLPLWYYISIPDGNYLRVDMEKAINNQLLIATQPHNAVVFLNDPSLNDTSQCAPFQGHCAYPQVKIDENSTRTVFSIVRGTVSCSGDISGEISTQLNNPEIATWFNLYFNRDSEMNGATLYSTNGDGGDSKYSGGVVKEPKLNLHGYNGILGNFGWILGYRLGVYTGSFAYISEGCYDAWGTKYLYIIVNDFNKNVNNFCIPSYNESMGKTNVLARISTNAVSGNDFSNGLSLTNNTVTNDKSIRKRFYFGPVNISRLELQIVDELGRTVDLNNMDYSMALNLICLYD
tara:strand:+ start:3346 stop:4821 length:1476 start_codon:yes stop_codon:yes gene_type:complete